jgi:thioredoxin-related protein
MFKRRLPGIATILIVMVMLASPAARVQAALNEQIVTPAVGPYELVIVEVENCVYCEVLRREVMPAYAMSEHGRGLPVRFLDLNTPEAAKLELVEPLTMVPTVLLVKANHEVGRAPGYMGPEGFFHAIRFMISNAP